MHLASTFVLISFWIMAGILLLLRGMPRAVFANRGEKEGFRFLTALLISFYLAQLPGCCSSLLRGQMKPPAF